MTPAARLLATGPDLDIDLPGPEAAPGCPALAALDLLFEAGERIALARLDLDPKPLTEAQKLLARAEAELWRYRQ